LSGSDHSTPYRPALLPGPPRVLLASPRRNAGSTGDVPAQTTDGSSLLGRRVLRAQAPRPPSFGETRRFSPIAFSPALPFQTVRCRGARRLRLPTTLRCLVVRSASACPPPRSTAHRCQGMPALPVALPSEAARRFVLGRPRHVFVGSRQDATRSHRRLVESESESSRLVSVVCVGLVGGYRCACAVSRKQYGILITQWSLHALPGDGDTL